MYLFVAAVVGKCHVFQVSQGSVVTYVRYGGNFLNSIVKEFCEF